MWDTLGDETYGNNPCTEDDMKKIIQDAVPAFNPLPEFLMCNERLVGYVTGV